MAVSAIWDTEITSAGDEQKTECGSEKVNVSVNNVRCGLKSTLN